MCVEWNIWWSNFDWNWEMDTCANVQVPKCVCAYEQIWDENRKRAQHTQTQFKMFVNYKTHAKSILSNQNLKPENFSSTKWDAQITLTIITITWVAGSSDHQMIPHADDVKDTEIKWTYKRSR